MRLSRVEKAVVALALVGLARASFFHLLVEPRTAPPAPIDRRFGLLRTLLPAQGEVGYLSDARAAVTQEDDPTLPGNKLYLEAQYALAPLVLRYGDDRAALVVADVEDPAGVESLARAHGLRVVARAGDGLAVLAP